MVFKEATLCKIMDWKTASTPTTISDIVGQGNFTNDLHTWSAHGEWPTSALLLVGPPGTGKTSSARLIAQLMFGQLNHIDYFETNGSDDRGIEFIRGTFKTALKSKPIDTVNRKLILIDEADGLTPVAQDAMRQLMENHNERCLVILTANEQNKIRPAIQSRCKIYNFTRVSKEEGAARLWDVLKQMTDGGTHYTDEVLTTWGQQLPRMVEHFQGDMRACLNFLMWLSIEPDSCEERLNELEAEVHVDMSSIILTNRWMELRQSLYQSLNSGKTLRSTMTAFYQDIHMWNDEAYYDVIAAYGDVMKDVYTWPGTDHSFCDYMVAKIRKEVIQ